MSDDQWIQASLPVRNGGLGIRSAVMLATSACLASAAGTRNLQDQLLLDVPLTITDPLVEEALSSWSSINGSNLILFVIAAQEILTPSILLSPVQILDLHQ